MTAFKLPPLTANDKSLSLSGSDLSFFQDLIFRLSGISMNDKKRDLVFSRLRSYIEKNGFGTFEAYRNYLSHLSPDHADYQKFVNLLTTNKTDFFREPDHFDHLINEVIPGWVRGKKKNISVWSCASSTGEEPYTLAMVLREHLPSTISFHILATDIDTDVLNTARNGVYPENKISEIPEAYQAANICKGQSTSQGWFKVTDRIHDHVTFQHYNLTGEDAVTGPQENPQFDLILCRNVLIYFSPQTIEKLMTKLHHHLRADGTLYIGHSESIQRSGHLFETIRPSIYRKA